MSEIRFKLIKNEPKKRLFLAKKTNQPFSSCHKKNLFIISKKDNYSTSQSSDLPLFEQNSSLVSTNNTQSAHLSTDNSIKKDESFDLKIYNDEEVDKIYKLEKNLVEKNIEIQFRRRDYLEILHELDPKKRRILLDWIMEVCCLFRFKRETYHLTVVLIDLYLSQIKTLSIKNFQLVGVTCLFIAAKNEEIIIPCVQNFAQSTNYAYISKQIFEYELIVLNHLGWRIQNLTLCFWANYIIYLWDDYSTINKGVPQFRRSAKMFLCFFGIIDTISLDYYHLSKDMKIIAASVLYLIIGLQMKYFSLNEINTIFTNNESYTDNYLHYNLYIDNFYREKLGLELNKCNDHISYVSGFFQQELFDNNQYYNNNEFIDIQNQDYSNVKTKLMETIEKYRK